MSAIFSRSAAAKVIPAACAANAEKVSYLGLRRHQRAKQWYAAAFISEAFVAHGFIFMSNEAALPGSLYLGSFTATHPGMMPFAAFMLAYRPLPAPPPCRSFSPPAGQSAFPVRYPDRRPHLHGTPGDPPPPTGSSGGRIRQSDGRNPD